MDIANRIPGSVAFTATHDSVAYYQRPTLPVNAVTALRWQPAKPAANPLIKERSRYIAK